jgi:DNA-binding response OmpR family regulator
MRDPTRVVIAEDDRARAEELQRILNSAGGYTTWRTSRVSEILDRLRDSNAYWLILDLELEDGNSIDLIRPIRERYGSDVYIIVVTGNSSQSPEYTTLGKGADLMFRKPYHPTALVAQMAKLQQLGEGSKNIPTKDMVLKIGECALIDLRNNSAHCVIRRSDGDEELELTGIHTQLLRYLASRRNPETHSWLPTERSVLISNVWGGEALMDIERSGANLRKNMQRLRELIGCDPIVIYHQRTHTTSYYLADWIVPMDELCEADRTVIPGDFPDSSHAEVVEMVSEKVD